MSVGVSLRITTFAAAVLSTGILAGCTGVTADEGSVDGAGAPLTLAQASLLAEVLHRNTEAGGATFVLTALDPLTGATVVLDGAVDWANGSGRASAVGLSDADGVVSAVAWTRDSVAEQRPGWAERLEPVSAGGGDPAAAFWLRGVDQTQFSVDRFISVVVGLAASRPDNAQLVLQKPEAAFVRDDVLRGVAVEVLRFSERTVLWIDPSSGELLRFEGNDHVGSAPVVVDVIERGPARIELPPVVRR